MRPNRDRIGVNDDFPEELDELVRFLEKKDPTGIRVNDDEYEPELLHLYYRMEARRCMARARFLLVNREIDTHDLATEQAILCFRYQFAHMFFKI